METLLVIGGIWLLINALKSDVPKGVGVDPLPKKPGVKYTYVAAKANEDFYGMLAQGYRKLPSGWWVKP